MADQEPIDRYCVIGAGASGLAVIKNFKQRGIPFDCFECLGEVGGIWNPDSPDVVYESTFLNSSRRLSRYTDFPMPREYPHYLSRAQSQSYLCAYAKQFGLYDEITFNTEVEKVEPKGKQWEVKLSGESKPRVYAGVVVANGHHWDAKMPEHPGKFDGEILHSHKVKSRDQLRGKRVLVVGAGNSGADIACDAAIDSEKAVHSMRRSYFFFPKLILGKPTDVFVDLTSRWPLPRWALRWIYTLGLQVIFGPHENYGLPAPDHKLFEAHPTAASTYLDHIAHGRIAPKPAIDRFEGKQVRFADGSAEEVDLVIYATGFQVSFPFMDKGLLLEPDGRSKLFLHVFHRQFDNLFAVGLMEPAEGGVWQLVDYQAQLIASFIVACARDPERAQWFRELKAGATPDIGHGIAFQETDWHRFEVQHYRYRSYMKQLIAEFGDNARLPFPARSPKQTAAAEPREAELGLAS